MVTTLLQGCENFKQNRVIHNNGKLIQVMACQRVGEWCLIYVWSATYMQNSVQ